QRHALLAQRGPLHLAAHRAAHGLREPRDRRERDVPVLRGHGVLPRQRPRDGDGQLPRARPVVRRRDDARQRHALRRAPRRRRGPARGAGQGVRDPGGVSACFFAPGRASRPMRALALSLLLALLCATPLAAPQTGPHLVAKNYAFEPQTLDVQGEGHTVTSVDGLWDTGLKQGGETATFTAPATPGTYKFYCRLHANSADPVDASHMTGLLVVRGANATASTPPPATASTPSTTPAGATTPAGSTASSRDPGFEAVALVAAAAFAVLLLRRR